MEYVSTVVTRKPCFSVNVGENDLNSEHSVGGLNR